jgi:MFS family permease
MLCSMRGLLILTLWLCNISLFLSRTSISIAILYMFPDNDTIEGELLAAFYVGYCFQTIGGWCASRCGTRVVLLCAITAWSVATLLTATVGLNIPALLALRAIVGLAEGSNYPCQMGLISCWVPYDERTSAWAFMSTGEGVGTMLALLGGPLVIHGDASRWPTVFWISGSIGLAVAVLFFFLGASTPSESRLISREELALIEATRPPRPQILRTPWRAIFRSRSFLAVVATHCCYNWACYFSLSWTAKFFQSSYSVKYSSLGVLSVLPYILGILVAAAAGRASDFLETRRGYSTNSVRKLMNTIGMLGGGAAFAALAIVAPGGGGDGHAKHMYAATALLTLAIGLGCTAASSGYWVCFVDLSPRHSQVLLAISNSFASLPGVGAGILTGRILDATHDNWKLMFLISAVVQVLGACVFIAFADLRDQDLGGDRSETTGGRLTDRSSTASPSAGRWSGRAEPLLVNVHEGA